MRNKGKKTLEALGLWDKIETGNMILPKNVSEVLAQVESGNVAAGMVYSSDAVRGKGVKQVEIFSDLDSPVHRRRYCVQLGPAAHRFFSFSYRHERSKVLELSTVVNCCQHFSTFSFGRVHEKWICGIHFGDIFRLRQGAHFVRLVISERFHINSIKFDIFKGLKNGKERSTPKCVRTTF